MFKFIGAIFMGSFAVSMGSILLWPVVILACFTTLYSGLSRFWPWIVGVVAYAIIVAIVVKLIPAMGIQIAIVFVATFSIGFNLTSGRTLNSSTVFIAILAMLLCLAFSAAVTKSDKFQAFGELAGAQLLWVAPLALLLYDAQDDNYSVYVLIATILGIIGTIVTGAQAWDKMQEG